MHVWLGNCVRNTTKCNKYLEMMFENCIDGTAIFLENMKWAHPCENVQRHI